jgi:hypothetical protein
MIAVMYFMAITIWYVRGCRKAEKKYQLEKKEIFNRYLIQDADKIVINYLRRKVIFHSAIEDREDEE